MPHDTQVSAVISKETKDLLEKHARATGVKKGFLLEMALLHHLRALQEIPADIIIPPLVVVTRDSGEQIARRLHSPRPSQALKDLVGGDGD